MTPSYSRDGGRHHLACFLAQQAAEKALKALLYASGAEAVWGHSTADLAARAMEVHEDLAPLRPRAALLDKYYIPTRYPNGLPGGIPAEAFDEVESARALELAGEVVDFARSHLIGG